MSAILAYIVSPIGRWLTIGAVVIAVGLGGRVGYSIGHIAGYHFGYAAGKAAVKKEWDGAVKKEIQNGDQARAEAEQQFPDIPENIVVPPVPGAAGAKRVCHKPLDRYDRAGC